MTDCSQSTSGIRCPDVGRVSDSLAWYMPDEEGGTPYYLLNAVFTKSEMERPIGRREEYSNYFNLMNIVEESNKKIT
ncbi:MAG: hypothetical protein JXR07_01130 [Reichenbachiella sp.]